MLNMGKLEIGLTIKQKSMKLISSSLNTIVA